MTEYILPADRSQEDMAMTTSTMCLKIRTTGVLPTVHTDTLTKSSSIVTAPLHYLQEAQLLGCHVGLPHLSLAETEATQGTWDTILHLPCLTNLHRDQAGRRKTQLWVNSPCLEALLE